MASRSISILGSTGSIGQNALRIIDDNPGRFRIVGLAAGKNLKLLSRQIIKYSPAYVSVSQEADAVKLEKMLEKKTGLDYRPEISWGIDGNIRVATIPEAETILSAVVGSAGLRPTYSAVKAGKRVALANKESIVMAGRIMMEEASRSGANILPVDSEHSAIFQSMQGHNRSDIKRLILTASGGPFLKKKKAALGKIKLRDALKHPNWVMGEKIAIDSATLMNKALEVIEARWLFDIVPEKISVMIHPQSVVHSIVEYHDGSMIAQMGLPDMRVPISYALVYPERLPAREMLNLEQIRKLTFEKPDEKRFPTVRLAYKALSAGDSMCVVLNAANEASVKAFVCGRIKFLEIARTIGNVVKKHRSFRLSNIDDALGVHDEYTVKTERLIGGLKI